MDIYVRFLVLSCVSLLGLSKIVFAQEEGNEVYYQPIQDVFRTELVYPQEKGEVQLTLMPVFGAGDDANYLHLPFNIEYGITNRWQVEIDWSVFEGNFPENGSNTSGIGDLELGTQYSFMKIGNSDFHAALGFEVGVPLNNGNESENELEFEPYFSLAKDFPALNHSQLFFQAGIGIAPDEDQEKELAINTGFFVPFNKIIFTSEFGFYKSEWEGGKTKLFYLTPGIVFNLPASWEAGVGAPIALNKQPNRFMVMAILTYEFNLGEDID